MGTNLGKKVNVIVTQGPQPMVVVDNSAGSTILLIFSEEPVRGLFETSIRASKVVHHKVDGGLEFYIYTDVAQTPFVLYLQEEAISDALRAEYVIFFAADKPIWLASGVDDFERLTEIADEGYMVIQLPSVSSTSS